METDAVRDARSKHCTEKTFESRSYKRSQLKWQARPAKKMDLA